MCAIMSLFIFMPQSAFGDIYSFKDESGVIHFSNTPCYDKRYELVFKQPRTGSKANLEESDVPKANCPKQAGQLEGSKTEQINPMVPPPVVVTRPSGSGVSTDSPLRAQSGNPPQRVISAPNLVAQEQPKDSTWKIWLGLFALVAIWLFTRRWFWVITFWVAGVASLFAMIASVIHFQILGALGFLVLMFICSATAAAIAER